MKVETLIDKVSAVLLFMTFPLVMTGGSAITNQPTPNAMVEGTSMTIAQLAGALVLAGGACFVAGLATLMLLLFIPRRVLRKELSRPSVTVEW